MDVSPMPVPEYRQIHFPPVAHKVWILNCIACNMFLTNRGMKAVLLLRPNVSLFSSDALPANCSAYSATPEVLSPPTTHKLNPSPRTCECLTQSLCCHGCGNTIGYMIVVPCVRCTSSMSASNRATNGHRFVFHSNEVSGTERHYVQDEPGVVPFELPFPTPPNPQYILHPSPHQSTYPLQTQASLSAGPSSPPFRADYLPTPPLEFASPEFLSPRHRSHDHDPSPQYYRMQSPPTSRFPPVIPARSSHYPLSNRPTSADSLTSGSPPPPFSPNFYPADQKEHPLTLPSLKPGDVIFWHHLARTGEIPGVNDDERARQPTSAKLERKTFFNR
ncbi:hypothetical protein M413DRAFT_173673 [Hebeloma cylindrosporum]|uniref:Uncharacterized protein n=1 Tax=Hebeloma cylindrosporum TaxID=76867 RepID=A0A0C2XRG7_HEBCY|nr:hypothetical protein M413DRAFT_173673 [Hebeloma cylindrosporum h7]